MIKWRNSEHGKGAQWYSLEELNPNRVSKITLLIPMSRENIQEVEYAYHVGLIEEDTGFFDVDLHTSRGIIQFKAEKIENSKDEPGNFLLHGRCVKWPASFGPKVEFWIFKTTHPSTKFFPASLISQTVQKQVAICKMGNLFLQEGESFREFEVGETLDWAERLGFNGDEIEVTHMGNYKDFLQAYKDGTYQEEYA